MNTKRKTYEANVGLKSESPGHFEACFATLNVEDRDLDLTRPHAFDWNGPQEVAIEPWNHGVTLPVGKGRVTEEGNKAIVTGRFLTETGPGMDHYRTVKELDSLTRWSYTFEILDSEPRKGRGRVLKRLRVIGVGPVTLPAGRGTGTRFVKRGGAHPEDDLNPANVLLDLEFEEVLLRNSKRSCDPKRMLDRLDELELELEMSKLRTELLSPKSAKSGATPPTNLDVIRVAAQARDPQASPAMVNASVGMALAARASNLAALYGDPTDPATRLRARQIVEAWALRPATEPDPAVMGHQGRAPHMEWMR